MCYTSKNYAVNISTLLSLSPLISSTSSNREASSQFSTKPPPSLLYNALPFLLVQVPFSLSLPLLFHTYTNTMSKKDCGNHDTCGCGCRWSCKIKKKYRKILIGLGLFILLIALLIFIIWLVLRPTKPNYYLQDLIVYNLNLTGPALLSATLQATLQSHNPNGRIGIYYDKLDVYAIYEGQQITIPTELPIQYQGHDDVSIWSPYLYGIDVPLAPYLEVALTQDEAAGYVLINVRVHGRLRWKVGTWISGNYHIDVNCLAFLTVGGVGMDGHGFQFKPISQCNVDV